MASHCCNNQEITISVTLLDASARVCAGVDWAKDDHAVNIVGPDGQMMERFMIEHTAAGLRLEDFRLGRQRPR